MCVTDNVCGRVSFSSGLPLTLYVCVFVCVLSSLSTPPLALLTWAHAFPHPQPPLPLPRPRKTPQPATTAAAAAAWLQTGAGARQPVGGAVGEGRAAAATAAGVGVGVWARKRGRWRRCSSPSSSTWCLRNVSVCRGVCTRVNTQVVVLQAHLLWGFRSCSTPKSSTWCPPSMWGGGGGPQK